MECLKKVTILVVDDEKFDLEMTCEAIETFASNRNLKIDVAIARNGEQALEYLRQSKCTPIVILLDLNMPRMGGIEFLQQVKSDPDFLWIPVVVLTTSDQPIDLQKAYRQHCNAYLQKPVHLEGLTQVMQTFGEFWIATNKPSSS